MQKEQTPHINVDYFEDLTGDIAAEKSEGQEEIGLRLRSLREEKGMSLGELSRLTGFDADFLSKIETREVYPQLGTVIRLSKALDAAFGQIIAGAGDKPYAITRMRDQKTVSRSTSHKGEKHIYSYKGLAPEVRGRSMEPLIVQLQESPEKDLSSHDGEEFIYVLNGTAVLELGDERFELEPGDSVYYLSSVPHWIAAKSATATILAVIYDK
ncbi:XRE family transcriptional regulator [Desulfonema ishimotonii]|uniref:XRE family transcriptional regulator n=1 Tax=Desulfonema ishimotonii TaxID=45657 RepID=A0A401G0E1_9BACT|nr:cupin domain-containing protein [Desulfonema ishimotonii]GBC62684.1 XRE family transcriptional regulator [Desulfonema ishimotonii]